MKPNEHPVLATQDIRSLKRRLKGRVVVVKQALFERMAHVASTGPRQEIGYQGRRMDR
jgi:hypothetical protein